MTDKEFVLSTLFEDFIKVAKVNLFTGEYIFIKRLQTEKEEICRQEKTIGAYVAKIIQFQLIHPDDVKRYRYYLDLEYIRSKLFKYKKERIVYSFRRKIGDIYRWVTFEIIIPKDFSEERPWVVFSWKDSDSDSRVMEDALNMLSMLFHKILKVNLTDDTYEEIKVYDQERVEECGFSDVFSVWLKKFAQMGYVFAEDLDEYYSYTNLSHIKQHFKKSKDCIRCRYRRKMGANFRWVTMEILPSIEYTDDNQIVMLYIRDIHDAHISELHYKKELEYYCNYDTLTGVWNRYYYDKCRSKYNKTKHDKVLAVMFADINGLKYVNDTYGHAEGDEYIKTFARLLSDTFAKECCFRISGDEFVVVYDNLSEKEAKELFEQFHAALKQQQKPMASIGWVWKEKPARLEELVSEAEQKMYIDKQEFHKNYPDLAR